MAFRKEKLAANLGELAAQFLQDIERSTLVTVTSVEVSDDEERATIGFTVFPDDREQAVLAIAKRRQKAFRAYAGDHLRTRRIPAITFAIDLGEKTDSA